MTSNPLKELGRTTIVKRAVVACQQAQLSPIIVITGLDGLSVERHLTELIRKLNLMDGLHFLRKMSWRFPESTQMIKAVSAMLQKIGIFPELSEAMINN